MSSSQIQWAVDLGTTNTVVAVAEGGSVRVLHLPEITRLLPAEHSPLIPSAIHINEVTQRWLYFFKRRVREVYVGQPALSRNYDGRSPAFAQSFKRYLASQPHRPIVKVGASELNVREIAHLFLDEVLKTAGKHLHCRPTDLTIPAPVGWHEHYRAELQDLVRRTGIKRFRSLDEPVAAALGYGVNVEREENLLIVDFGGGTLNMAVVRLGPRTAESGAAPVLAKHMVQVGGNDVDDWILKDVLPKELQDIPEWHTDARWEAMRVKEMISQGGTAEFRWGGLQRMVSREDLVRIMEEHGLYAQIRRGLEDIRHQIQTDPLSEGGKIDEVLMVGGSTLLPEVAAAVDDTFPEAVVRHDPLFVFTSVALGAARYAGGVPVDDFVYHDYALAVQNERTHTVEYELLIPRRTRYPTASDFTVRYYADFAGMSEMRFSIGEVGRLGQAPVPWQVRPNGNRYWAPGSPEERALVVELNPADPPLPLRPAGQGTSPRLRVTYSINRDRWLCTTVEDLIRKQPLRINEPVVRLR